MPPPAPLVMLVRTGGGTVGAAGLVAATGPRLRQAWRSAREEEPPAAGG